MIQPITNVPKMSKNIKGVIEIRRAITPIIDLTKVLLEEGIKDNEETRIILVQVNEKSVGLIVDAATNVLNIPSDCIQQVTFTNGIDLSFLLGIATIDTRLLILLDINILIQDTQFGINELNKLYEAI